MEQAIEHLGFELLQEPTVEMRRGKSFARGRCASGALLKHLGTARRGLKIGENPSKILEKSLNFVPKK